MSEMVDNNAGGDNPPDPNDPKYRDAPNRFCKDMRAYVGAKRMFSPPAAPDVASLIAAGGYELEPTEFTPAGSVVICQHGFELRDTAGNVVGRAPTLGELPDLPDPPKVDQGTTGNSWGASAQHAAAVAHAGDQVVGRPNKNGDSIVSIDGVLVSDVDDKTKEAVLRTGWTGWTVTKHTHNADGSESVELLSECQDVLRDDGKADTFEFTYPPVEVPQEIPTDAAEQLTPKKDCDAAFAKMLEGLAVMPDLTAHDPMTDFTRDLMKRPGEVPQALDKLREEADDPQPYIAGPG